MVRGKTEIYFWIKLELGRGSRPSLRALALLLGGLGLGELPLDLDLVLGGAALVHDGLEGLLALGEGSLEG